MWINAILLTLLFFLICLGFGLFILAMSSIAVIQQSRLTRLQLIVLGFTIGGPAASVFLQLLSLVSHNLRADLGTVLLISLIGFSTTSGIWYPRKEDRKQIAMWAALSIPLALITWWWSFAAFSNFPYGDIGADVHWLKTAREFADTGTINPFASQSYTDLRTALAGALSGALGLDLLRFNWTYRFFSIFGLLVFFYAVADGIFIDRQRKWFAFFFAAASNTLGLITNGSLAVASSLVFLSALLRTDAKQNPPTLLTRPNLLVAAGSFGSILLAFLLNNNALMLALMMTTALAFNLLNRIGSTKALVSGAFVSVIWSMALTLAHRGAYLFVPITIVAWLLWHVIYNVISASSVRSIRALWAISLALPLVCLGALAAIIAARLGYLPSMQGDELFSRVTMLIVGKPIQPGDDIILGAGPDVAAIEIGRAIGPGFAIGIGLAMLSWCAVHRPSHLRQSISSPSEDRNVALLLWSWITGCTLVVVALSGFPFLYRIDFIICGLFAIAATELFFQFFADQVGPGANRGRVTAVAIAVVAATLVGCVYSTDWPLHVPFAGYQAMLRPLELAAVAMILIFAALTFVPARRIQILALAVTVSLGVALDRSALSTLFKVYSYGRLPEHSTAISHYDASDLRTAQWLRDNRHDFIIISDPYTLGLAQAITGAPGIYLFSNLDTVNEATANQVRDVISAMVSAKGTNRGYRTCASLSPLLANLNEEAHARMYGSNLAQGIPKPVKPGKAIDQKELLEGATPRNSEDILRQLDVLNGGEKKWDVIAIINPRTIEWLHLNRGDRLPYFPIDEPLKDDTLKTLDGPFHTLFSDKQSVVVLIECTETTLHSDGNGL